MIAAPNRYAVRPVRSPRDATFRTCCCATAKSWAGCASISLGGAEQAFTWWHPERSPAARPRPRHAQACGKRRARSGKTEIIIDAHRPRRFLPRQWLSAGWMGDAGPLPATPIRVGKRLPW